METQPIELTPSVRLGQSVFYHRPGSADGKHPPGVSPATVTQLGPGGVCHLFIMNPNGFYFNPTPYSAQVRAGHWSFGEHGDV